MHAEAYQMARVTRVGPAHLSLGVQYCQSFCHFAQMASSKIEADCKSYEGWCSCVCLLLMQNKPLWTLHAATGVNCWALVQLQRAEISRVSGDFVSLWQAIPSPFPPVRRDPPSTRSWK